jgi:hypothetical protein
MKILVLFFCIVFCGAASAQCNFPTEVEGVKVTGVYAYQAKIYLAVTGKGFIELIDSSGKYQIRGYSNGKIRSYAQLSCGDSIPVKMGMPNIYSANGLTPIQSAGREIRKGANIAMTGFIVGGLLVGISYAIPNSTIQKVTLFSGLGFSTILPLAGLTKIATGGRKMEYSKL